MDLSLYTAKISVKDVVFQRQRVRTSKFLTKFLKIENNRTFRFFSRAAGGQLNN